MEQRLIDANPIFDKVEANYRMSEGVQHKTEREFLNLICDAPTVDAVPVVRCNNCDHMKWKRSVYVDGTINRCRRCEIDHKEHPNDWFCADGERKDGEK